MDEIFGEKNFRNEIIWHYYNGSCNSKLHFGNKHDTIYFYAKGKKNTFNVDEARVPHSENSAWIKNKKKGIIDKKWGVPNPKGKKRDDVFRIPTINNMAKERIGYRTQKPETLISSLVSVLSNKNDVVLDCFSGGGTTAKVCWDLGRKFIAGDISPVAIRVIKERLNEAECYNFIECNPYLTKAEWKLISGHVFADKICEYMKWHANPKKSGDGGIDGWVDDLKKIPVQIKNSGVNVPVVRELAGVCNATYKTGVVVGWSFSKGCYEFVSELERKSNIKIELKLADTIVKPVEFMKKADWNKLYKERVLESKRKPQYQDTTLGGQQELLKKKA